MSSERSMLALSHFSGGVDRAIPVLLKDVATNTDYFRPNYAEIAESMRPSPAAVSILIESLESDDGLVREAAATLLTRIEPPPVSAAPVLVAAVKKAISVDEGGAGSDERSPRQVGKSDGLAAATGSAREQPPPGSVSADLAIAMAKTAPPGETFPLLMQLLKAQGCLIASRGRGGPGRARSRGLGRHSHPDR